MVVHHPGVRINSVTPTVDWTIHFLLLRSGNINHVVTQGMLLILEFLLCRPILLLILSLVMRRDSLSISCTDEFLHLLIISDLDSVNIEFFA